MGIILTVELLDHGLIVDTKAGIISTEVSGLDLLNET
jgi:hypothetical protein